MWMESFSVTHPGAKLFQSWNAMRLMQAIPGCCLEAIKHCGHLPHENKVLRVCISCWQVPAKGPFDVSGELSLPVVVRKHVPFATKGNPVNCNLVASKHGYMKLYGLTPFVRKGGLSIQQE